MRKPILFVLLCFFSYSNGAYSQAKKNVIDSVEIVLKENKDLKSKAPKKDFFKIDTSRINTLNFLSNELVFRGDFIKAKLLLNEALELANKIDYKKGQANAYCILGEMYRRKSEYPLALQNLVKSLKISKEIGYKVAMANTYHNLANVYNNTTNYPEALKNNFAALKIREELNDKIGISRSYNNLGINNNKIGNYIESLKYYNKSLAICQELNDKRGISNFYNNLGVLYHKQEKFREALVNYFEVEELSLELNDILSLANVYLNIGMTYCSLLEYDKSLDYIFKALRLQKSLGNNFGIVKCFIYTSNTYKKINKLETSRIYLDSALRLSKEIGSKQLIRDSYEQLSEVDSMESDWINAYINYKTYTKYKDSIINKDNTEKMVQSQIQYELEKQDLVYQKLLALKAIQFEYKQKQATVKTEKERQKLNYEQKIKEQKLDFEYSKRIAKVQNKQKQQLALNAILAKENTLMIQNSRNEAIIRWFMILALFAFVAFGIYYYRNYINQKASNIIIAKQREDLKALIHELNHRVKNNFQTVASMLNMQTRLLEDTALVDVLVQTSNRFLAISSVHEKLYQLDGFSDIPIKEYLFDIVTNISSQFGVNKDGFKYNIIDNSDLKVNIQTVLPLVLIVNELATNTFKHAYSADRILVVNIVISQINGSTFQLIYKDNGPGLPENFTQSTRFGLKLLKLFAEQLHGNIEFFNDNGAVFKLTFEYE